jgi:hypothetical protein
MKNLRGHALSILLVAVWLPSYGVAPPTFAAAAGTMCCVWVTKLPHSEATRKLRLAVGGRTFVGSELFPCAQVCPLRPPLPSLLGTAKIPSTL